ncbi:MAG: T9SS type A sorting domain-containing protein [Candidatus Neomarinimicrobiota bacterium]
MNRYVPIILYLGLGFSQNQEFLYSTLVDTSFEYGHFSWTSAVYKFDEQGLNIEQLIPASSKIEDISENQSKILCTSGDTIMVYENGLLDTLNVTGLVPRFIYNGDIIFFKNTSELLFELHRYSFSDNSNSMIADSFETSNSYTFPYYLSSDKEKFAYLENTLSDTTTFKIFDILSGSQTDILSLYPSYLGPWSLYWAYDDYLYFTVRDSDNIPQLFSINSSGTDEVATQLTFLEYGFNSIPTNDSHLDRIVGTNDRGCDIWDYCDDDFLSYNLQNGQISVIGQIAMFSGAVYHTWSADYSKLAVGLNWDNSMSGEVSIFNFTTGENSFICQNIFRRDKLFWAGGQENVSLSESTSLPNKFMLHQNYPNPFNPKTTLEYELPLNAFIKITIYDLLGNEVKNLVSTNQSPGFKSIQWNSTNNQGEPVSAGVYLYNIEAGDYRQTKKMILLK